MFFTSPNLSLFFFASKLSYIKIWISAFFFVPLPVGLICLARRFKPLCIYISFLLDLFFCPLESFHYLLESFYYPLESFRYLRR